MHVSYEEHPDYPGLRFFKCEPLWAKLTPAACARNAAASATIQCARCSIGKLHASGLATQSTDHNCKPRAALVRPCVRCNTGAFRLVGGMVCVSCYNRQREVRIGANAKGQPPRHVAAHLHQAACLVELNGEALLLEFEYCSGPDEAKRVVERRWPGALLVDYEIRAGGIGAAQE